MTTITVSVPGMTCGHCVAAVTDETSKIPGVEAVAVDLDTKLVTLSGTALLDDDATRALIADAVDEAGFEIAVS